MCPWVCRPNCVTSLDSADGESPGGNGRAWAEAEAEAADCPGMAGSSCITDRGEVTFVVCFESAGTEPAGAGGCFRDGVAECFDGMVVIVGLTFTVSHKGWKYGDLTHST